MAASSIMPATVTALPAGSQVSGASSSPGGAGGANSTLNENAFLQLLTTQLEHQDPLNPVSPSDFAAELAQFATATGVQNLNTAFAAAGGLQAAALVGRNVAVAGNTLVLGAGSGATGAFSLPGAASDVRVTIANAQGQVVGFLDLGPMAAGTQSFAWNGQTLAGTAAPPGVYRYTLSATGTNGAALAATSFSVVPVTAVSLGGTGGPSLSLGGGLAPVALSAVQQVF